VGDGYPADGLGGYAGRDDIPLAALVDVRRMIGVTALVYTIAHMVIYFALRHWDFASIANDMTTRLTLIVATLSTIGLIVLGATSVDAAIQSMGAKNWQRLHTTNYVISALAILHVVLARGTYAEQYMLTGIFFWLMVWRVLARYALGATARRWRCSRWHHALSRHFSKRASFGRARLRCAGDARYNSPWHPDVGYPRHGRCSHSDFWSRWALPAAKLSASRRRASRPARRARYRK